MSDAIGRRVANSILEHVASSIEAEAPMIRHELIMEGHRPTGEGDRLYRLSHPTAMDEEIYVLVTVKLLDRIEASRLIPPHDQPPLDEVHIDNPPRTGRSRHAGVNFQGPQQDPVARLIDENRYLTDDIRHHPQPGEFGPWGPEGRPPSPDQLG